MEASKVRPIDFGKMFEELVCGNTPALEFLLSYTRWVHFIDDVIDKEVPDNGGEYILLVSLDLLRTAAFNPFWQQHKDSLFPLVMQGFNTYADSNLWVSRADFRDQASAAVLKSEYQSLFYHVAFLCGGYDHMRAMSQKYRTYDYDDVGK